MKPPTAQQMHTASDGATNIEMTWDEDVAHNKRQTDSEGWNAFDRTSMNNNEKQWKQWNNNEQ